MSLFLSCIACGTSSWVQSTLWTAAERSPEKGQKLKRLKRAEKFESSSNLFGHLLFIVFKYELHSDFDARTAYHDDGIFTSMSSELRIWSILSFFSIESTNLHTSLELMCYFLILALCRHLILCDVVWYHVIGQVFILLFIAIAIAIAVAVEGDEDIIYDIRRTS